MWPVFGNLQDQHTLQHTAYQLNYMEKRIHPRPNFLTERPWYKIHGAS